MRKSKKPSSFVIYALLLKENERKDFENSGYFVLDENSDYLTKDIKKAQVFTSKKTYEWLQIIQDYLPEHSLSINPIKLDKTHEKYK